MVQTTPTGTVHNGQSPGNPNSWALIEAAQGGDRDAFGQLYARYAGGVSKFVGNRLRDRGAVEDLTSETFTRALRRIDSVHDQGRDVGAWFTTVARNLVLDHVKSSRHRLETVTADLPEASPARDDRGPEQVVIENETNADLHRHVAALSPDQQECIRRRFLQELSVAETAAVMGRGQGAVKALTHRAIVGLRAAMIGDHTTPVARAAAGRELPAHPGGFADKPRGADPLDRARRAVGEVRQHRAAAEGHAVAEQGRAQQVARWHAEDQAVELAHRGLDRGAVALDAEGGAG
jgi:RNA polymerase sigma factor (sigma-70 family)